VRSFEREPIDEGAGFVGELTRLKLTYDRPDATGPKSLISKLPTSDEAYLIVARLLNLYEREIRFYDEIAEQVELRTPERYFSAMDQSADRYVLLLEDLAPGRCGDQIASCSLEEAKVALTEIAKFHAAWCISPRLKEFDWMPGIHDGEYRKLLEAAYRQSWPAFVDGYRDLVPADIIEIGERFGTCLDAMLGELGRGPQTIMHTDFRLDNMFFDLADGSPVAVFDWQLATRGGPMFDVVYFLAGNFPRDFRRRHEAELLRAYHDALLRGGATGYDFQTCHEDYRAAALILLLFMVTNRENFDINDYNERAQKLISEMNDRYSWAILDLNAAEFLPG